MPIIKTISTGNGIAGAARVELAKLQRHIPGTDLSAPAGLASLSDTCRCSCRYQSAVAVVPGAACVGL